MGTLGDGCPRDHELFCDRRHGAALAAGQAEGEGYLPGSDAGIIGEKNAIDRLLDHVELAPGGFQECPFADLVDVGPGRVMVRFDILDGMSLEYALAH